MTNSSAKLYSIISGTVFLLLLFIFFVLVPCPSNPQLNFFRIFIALAGGSFAATIPGTFNVKKTWLSATSSLGVFALIYLLNPADWKSSDCNLRNLKATVYIDDKLTQGVEITMPDIGQRFYTDEFGNINIEYSADQIKVPTTLIFKYKSELDTTVKLNALEKKMDFKFTIKPVGISSIQDNSYSYTYKDLTINMSLINQVIPKTSDTEDEQDAEDVANSIIISDTVSYSFRKNGDTILITPNSKLLTLLANNEPIRDFDYFIFDMNLPELDIKFTNNSNDAIFFNKLTFQVVKSVPNNDAIFIPWASDEDISLINVGWGKARDIRIDFSTNSKNPIWDKPFEEHIEYKDWDTVEVKTIREPIYTNLIKKGIDERYLRDGEFHMGSVVPSETTKAKAGEFIKGAYVFGTVTFTDQTHVNKVQKFISYIALGAWPGGAEEDFSWKYNTVFKPEGENYKISIPMSNSLKPKDFDRIALAFSSSQSSSHCFYLTFHYNDKDYRIPNPFKMEYFFRSDMQEYLQRKIDSK